MVEAPSDSAASPVDPPARKGRKPFTELNLQSDLNPKAGAATTRQSHNPIPAAGCVVPSIGAKHCKSCLLHLWLLLLHKQLASRLNVYDSVCSISVVGASPSLAPIIEHADAAHSVGPAGTHPAKTCMGIATIYCFLYQGYFGRGQQHAPVHSPLHVQT